MENMTSRNWEQINQLKKFYDERCAISLSKFKAEPEGEPGEQLMTQDEWLAARQLNVLPLALRNGLTDEFIEFQNENTLDYAITASESAAVLGISPWTSQTELWASKRGLRPNVEKKMNEKALARGHFAEDYVLYVAKHLLNEMYGAENVYFWHDKRIFISKEHPWMMSNTDGHCVIRDKDGNLKFGLIEAKTVGSHNYKAQAIWKDGQVPEYYECQCVHEMSVLGADFCMLIACWDLEIDGYAAKLIFRDQEKEDDLVEKERLFVEMIRNDIEPEDILQPVLKSSFLGRMWAKTDHSTIALSDKERPLIEKIQKLDDKIDYQNDKIELLKQQKAKLTNALHAVFKEAEYGTLQTDEGRYVIRERRGKHRDSYDFDRLKAEKPELYEKYVKTIEVLDRNSAELEDKIILDEYRIEGEPNGETFWTLSLIQDVQKKETEIKKFA